MNIKSVDLKNFTVFTDFHLDVNSGVNVFVGENGTGKTHLLKAIYAACEISKDNSLGANFLERCFKNNGAVELFRYDENKDLDVSVKADCTNKEYIAVKLAVPVLNLFGDKSGSKSESCQIHLQKDVIFDATFIPCKDMLTHSNGLPAMADRYNVPFDRTLIDIIRRATRWTLKNPPNMAIKILPMLEEMMSGQIIFDHEEFIVKKRDGRMINFAVEAEGFKKVGLLW